MGAGHVVCMNEPELTARFEAVFRAHHPVVSGYALRRTDPATAEEVVADTFLVCWRRLEEVPKDAVPWLFGVARRCLANRRREAERAVALGKRVGGAQGAQVSRDPADIVGDRDVIRIAFAQLSETDREVLRLVAWEGLNDAAAARAAGCLHATFAVRLYRARRRLAARLARLETDPQIAPAIKEA